MSKQSGLGDRLYVGGYDLSGDVGSVQTIRGGRAVLDVTGIDKSAFERISGLKDGEITFIAFFNPEPVTGTGLEVGAHPVLSALPTADTVVSYHHGGSIGDPAASLIGKQINYDPNRGQDGSLTFTIQAMANGYGLEWGVALSAFEDTIASAGNLTAWDSTIATATEFGLQAYMHVFDLASGTATVAVQDSADGSTDWQNVTGAVFTAVAAGSTPQSQRLQTTRTQTVRRHLRVNTTGTFTDLVLAVMVVKNLSETLF